VVVIESSSIICGGQLVSLWLFRRRVKNTLKGTAKRSRNQNTSESAPRIMENHIEELPEYGPAPRPPLMGPGHINSSLERRFVLQAKSGREWLSFKMKE
jgi:hypothetical protein